MFQWLAKTIGLTVFVVAGSVAIWFYQDKFSARQQIAKLEEEKRVLKQVVSRLTDEKRVAEVLVTDQSTVDGVLRTTLLLVEYDKAGQSLSPRSFTIDGKVAHLDALVIKFERDFVQSGDGLRGHSIALFARMYGDKQSPESGYALDEPGSIPPIYRGAEPRVTQFETDLWKKFWQLADDPSLRESSGVRVANGQGVWGPFEPDKLYTITLESDGGLNVSAEPIRGIYREALKHRVATTQPM